MIYKEKQGGIICHDASPFASVVSTQTDAAFQPPVVPD